MFPAIVVPKFVFTSSYQIQLHLFFFNLNANLFYTSAASIGKCWVLFIHSTSVYRGKVAKSLAMNQKFDGFVKSLKITILPISRPINSNSYKVDFGKF